MRNKWLAKLCIAGLIGAQMMTPVRANVIPNVKAPALADDFSNVINFEQYSGFTKEQLELLRKNGFVVMQPRSYGYLKMHEGYESAEYSHSPIFITTDAVLNLYHIFYGDSLKLLELSTLNDAMRDYSKLMLQDSLACYKDCKDTGEREQYKLITTYFAVANMLMGEKTEVPAEIQKLASEEINLIKAAKGIEQSPLLGTKMDYSQYIVRGHYTSSTKLDAYFKTMMWYGQVGFELIDDEGNVKLENAKLSSRMSFMILNNEKAYKLWQKVYTATSTYVGVADDIAPTDLEKMMKEVYGAEVTNAKISDKKYDEALANAVKALPEPQIQGKLAVTTGMTTGKQFRMMGQRYTLDGDIMQQVIVPIKRPENSGLDVMAALGSDRAMELAEKYENPNNWADYSTKLEKAQKQCEAVGDATWQSNMYNGWLWTLESEVKSFEDVAGMPSFMQTEAWTDKSLVAALGSYAELKHDTVLYCKQPMAERGGPEEEMPYLYVEPNVGVYTKLLSLLNTTKQNLKDIGALDKELSSMLDTMTKYMNTMKSCAIKELTNKQFTEDEYYTLKAFGGMVDNISNQLLYEARKYDEGIADTYTSALISDISNIIDTGECVEIGTGMPWTIYVICPYNGQLFLAEGTTFSYYEFTSKERLTDEKWHQMLGMTKKTNEEYGYDYIERDPKKAESCNVYTPQWISSYVSKDADNVIKMQVEVNWKGAYTK